MKPDRDADRVARDTRDLWGASNSPRALAASVAWNRLLRRLARDTEARETAHREEPQP